MNHLSLISRIACVVAVTVFAVSSLDAQTVMTTLIDDNFTDGDAAVTGTSPEGAETAFFTTSSSSGLNTMATPGSGLGFVTGSSGRAIHTTFAPTTLATAGDRIDVSFSFTTPNNVQTNTGDEEFRFGLFDTTNGASQNIFTGVNQTAGPVTTFVPGSANDTGMLIDFNSNIASATANNQPGLLLNGFTSEFDIENDNPDADISFRVSDLNGVSGGDPPTVRLITTTNGFDGLGSGPGFGFTTDVDGDGVFDAADGDVVNTFDPNTDYVGTLSIVLLANGDFEITSSVDGGTLIASNNIATDTIAFLDSGTDAGLNTNTFNFLGFGASSDAFGLSNAQDTPDNGIRFTNLSVVSTLSVPEPSSLALLGLVGCAGLVRRRR